MDQSAFRQLLDTPRAGSSASQTPRPRFGQAPPKRGGPLPKDESAKAELKPRSQKTKEWQQKKKDQKEADGYRDRAKERRLGKEGDFSAAEKLLEDFQARAQDPDVDKQTLEDQMKYLGGDAEHSVLVKGLDFALLERQKYELAHKADPSLAEVEDQLDRALADDPSTSAPAASTSAEPRKRSRDEMLADLRAKHGPGAPGPGAASGSGAGGLGKGFKPIGFKPIGAKDGERKKKKKKVKEGEVQEGAKKEARGVAEVAERRMAEPLITAEVDDDDDIFGEAGEWKAEDDSDDSDDVDDAKVADKKARPAPTVPGPIPPARPPVKYFDDDEDDTPAGSSSTTAPSAITNLANQPQQSEGTGSGSRPLEDGEEEEDGRPMRLQGLSGSALPSARELLDMDAAREAEEKRKERKEKFKASAAEKKALAEANMTDADKLNRDHQVMERYLEKEKARKETK